MPVDLWKVPSNLHDSDECLAWLLEQTYPVGTICTKCGKAARLYKSFTSRPMYTCACGKQIYPMVGTIFHKSRTPLIKWFYAVEIIRRYRGAVTVLILSSHLGVTYKTAWRMGELIRNELWPGYREQRDARRGVYRYGAATKWRARTKIGDKYLHLGMFDSPEDAKARYDLAQIVLKRKH